MSDLSNHPSRLYSVVRLVLKSHFIYEVCGWVMNALINRLVTYQKLFRPVKVNLWDDGTWPPVW